MRKKYSHHHLLRDVGVIALSVLIAYLLVKNGAFENLLRGAAEMKYWGSFIAGLFFTSAFTTAPAIAALAEIAKFNSPWMVAAIGALGSVTGDFLIFRFIRESVTDDLRYLFQLPRRSRWVWIFHLRLFHWVLALLGALIIASPLPDELGVALLGISKTSTKRFLLISFAFNFMGILIIGFLGRAWL